MNRDIKFRAYRKFGNEMYYGREVPLSWIWGDDDRSYDKIVSCFWLEQGDYHELVLMQYTGLKDVNGVDIYEGDVVYIAGQGNTLVEFPFVDLYMAKAENDIGKIIGNIYENPDLLDSNR